MGSNDCMEVSACHCVCGSTLLDFPSPYAFWFFRFVVFFFVRYTERENFLFFVLELHKRLMKRSTDFMEVRVIDAMDGICSNENFKVYDYIPPKMVRACKYIIGEASNSISLGEHIENITSVLLYF